jgi:hypothetical protein
MLRGYFSAKQCQVLVDQNRSRVLNKRSPRRFSDGLDSFDDVERPSAVDPYYIYLTADGRHAVTLTQINDRTPNFDDLVDFGEVGPFVGSSNGRLGPLARPLAVPADRVGELLSGNLRVGGLAEAVELAAELAEPDAPAVPTP